MKARVRIWIYICMGAIYYRMESVNEVGNIFGPRTHILHEHNHMHTHTHSCIPFAYCSIHFICIGQSLYSEKYTTLNHTHTNLPLDHFFFPIILSLSILSIETVQILRQTIQSVYQYNFPISFAYSNFGEYTCMRVFRSSDDWNFLSFFFLHIYFARLHSCVCPVCSVCNVAKFIDALLLQE